MKKIMEVDFAITEFHLYLDTHPSDSLVAAKLEDYRTKCKVLKKEYESKYGPISSSGRDASRWSWIKDPWPWDDCQNSSLKNVENMVNEGGLL
jgi:spore coat protein JB